MDTQKAQQLAKETAHKVEDLKNKRLPEVEVVDIYAEDGFVIGPDEILNAFKQFKTDDLPKKVEELRKRVIETLTAMNAIVEAAQQDRIRVNEQIDLEVGNLIANLRDNVRDLPESRMTRKLRIGKKIIEDADRPLLKEAYRNLGFTHCSIEPTSDYIYFDPEAGDIRKPFLQEFHRITNNKYPSLSNYVQCDNSGIENIDVLLYVVNLK
jgi:hypothetical protein